MATTPPGDASREHQVPPPETLITIWSKGAQTRVNFADPQSDLPSNPGPEPAPAVGDAKEETLVTIWSKAVETQMHFNEMSVKSRQLGLTFVAAALGFAATFLVQEGTYTFDIIVYSYTLKLHLAVLLILAGLLALNAVKVLDLKVYHRMLRGAVAFGEDLEERHINRIDNLRIGMTQAISHFSRLDDAKVTRTDDGRYRYEGTVRVTAETKIRRFYRNTSVALIGSAIFVLVMTNINTWLGPSVTASPAATQTPPQPVPNP